MDRDRPVRIILDQGAIRIKIAGGQSPDSSWGPLNAVPGGGRALPATQHPVAEPELAEASECSAPRRGW